MYPKIIFENEEYFILDKPSGWVVNRSETTKDTPVLENWLEGKKYDLSGDPEYRSGIVHRLDKETSGILIIAKNKEAFGELQDQFKKRIVEKKYIALVHGHVAVPEGLIEASVGRLPWRRERFGVLQGGRDAVTNYKLENFYTKDGENYSLLSVYPKTGRTHQIRVHLKFINHPIVSDPFYAGRKTARKDRKWCPRLFLHAAGIKFIDPKTRKDIRFESPLSEDLLESLSSLSSELKMH